MVQIFLQPRRESCSDVEHPPPVMVGSRFSDATTGKPVQHQNLQEVDVEELEEEVELLRRKLAKKVAKLQKV